MDDALAESCSKKIRQLRAELEAVKKERDELHSALSVVWCTQTQEERERWDAKAIQMIDGLIAGVDAIAKCKEES